MSRPRSGSLLVLGLFGFGLALTALLYGYWSQTIGPFRPLTDALAARWPNSSPRVDGGRARLDRQGGATLRIVMQVPFDPQTDSPQAESFARDVLAFAAARIDATVYDTASVHLYSRRPGGVLSQATVRLPVAKGGERAEDGGKGRSVPLR